MFSYYGAKTKIAALYPKPVNNKIIEPFAGSAKYSLLHFENDVLLCDAYSVIIEVWKWLQSCSEKDILSLPKYNIGDRIIKQNLDCDPQYEFLRFLLQEGTVGGNKVYEFGLKNYERRKIKIAADLYKIRHWKFINTSFELLNNQECTWFIDPPYQVGGHRYKKSNKFIDFNYLAEYCKNRNGQVIVCENMQANWLPFVPLKIHKGLNNINQIEAIWTNYHTHYNNKQQTLF